MWHSNSHGFYNVQQPGIQPELNLRGLFTTDDDGRLLLPVGACPQHYPIPDDGPVGDLLRRTSRHPYRPAHIHLIAAAEGHRPVTTHLFVEGSPYLDDDTVFGVKQSLVRPVTVEGDDRVLDFDVTLT